MWRKYWLNGVLGLWVILLAFLGFPSTARRVLLVVTGLLIAVVSFSKASHRYIEETGDEKSHPPR